MLSELLLNKPFEYKTRTYHMRVGAGWRTAGREGGAETGWTGRRPFLPFAQDTLLPFSLWKLPSMACLCKHDKTNSSANQLRNDHNQRFIRGNTIALHILLQTSVPTPNCRCQPFSCMACQQKCLLNGYNWPSIIHVFVMKMNSFYCCHCCKQILESVLDLANAWSRSQ